MSTFRGGHDRLFLRLNHHRLDRRLVGVLSTKRTTGRGVLACLSVRGSGMLVLWKVVAYFTVYDFTPWVGRS
jgi:hypothetical protein